MTRWPISFTSLHQVVSMFRAHRVVAAALLAVLAPVAQADTATLTISGRVLPGTCVLTAAAVKLPDIKANDLVDRLNPPQSATLNLDGCVGVTRAILVFDGTAESFDPQLWKNTASTGAASGVSFAILQGNSGTTYIKKGTSLNVTVSGATARQPIRVGYYRTTAQGINAGAMSADITITASYQ